MSERAIPSELASTSKQLNMRVFKCMLNRLQVDGVLCNRYYPAAEALSRRSIESENSCNNAEVSRVEAVNRRMTVDRKLTCCKVRHHTYPTGTATNSYRPYIMADADAA